MTSWYILPQSFKRVIFSSLRACGGSRWQVLRLPRLPQTCCPENRRAILFLGFFSWQGSNLQILYYVASRCRPLTWRYLQLYKRKVLQNVWENSSLHRRMIRVPFRIIWRSKRISTETPTLTNRPILLSLTFSSTNRKCF